MQIRWLVGLRYISRLVFTPPVLTLVSAAIAVAAYLQVISAPFGNGDDFVYIVDNTKLLGLHVADLWRIFVEPFNPWEFLPLRDLSYWFDFRLFGLSPSAFRTHNILLYLLTLAFVYATTQSFWRYFLPDDTANAPLTAAIVTGLFALHPAHVESVVWISGRKDVLSGLFSMCALWLAVNTKHAHGISTRYAIATLIAILAAMLSKATTIAVAPIISVLWIMFWRDTPKAQRHPAMFLWPLIPLLLAACVSSIFFSHSQIKEDVYWGTETITRVLALLGWFARLTLTPESRHVFYPVFEDPWFPVMVASGGLVLLLAISGAVITIRRKSLAGFSLLSFALLCMPYAQLIPFHTTTIVADRFVFLALWPVTLMLVLLASSLKILPRTVLLLAFALPWTFQTIERPRDWQDSKSLVDSNIRAYPGHYLPAADKALAFREPWWEVDEARRTAETISDSYIRNIVVKTVGMHYENSVSRLEDFRENPSFIGVWPDPIHLPDHLKWNPAAGVIVSAYWVELTNMETAAINTYTQGDYATAFAKFDLLAAAGNIRAQQYLREMMAQGLGVPQDRHEAIK